MDRERVIREIAALLATLEKASAQDVEKTKKFLRWMTDSALLDMLDKHKKAIQKKTYIPAER